jgi:CBS domain-containing protein
MKVHEIMTASPACCTPDDTAEHAARLMTDRDCGCLPVVDDTSGRRVVGVVTDRDLATRALGQGRGPETRVGDVMTADPSCCRADDEVETVERVMTQRQVRRVPVVDEAGCCVGMIAQADLARDVSDQREVGRVVEAISQPGDRGGSDRAGMN